MATLNKLRNSKIVLIVVLVSLGLFVASDYFSSSNKYSFSAGQPIGEIDGKDVTLQEFDARYKEILDKMAKNGTAETEETRTQASNYAWDQFVQEYVIDKEYEKIGIDVSLNESSELLYSDNPHQYIQQFFSRFSEDGVFRPANVVMAKNRAKKDPEMKLYFENIVQEVFKDVLFRKYNAAISKSLYATALDAEDDFYSSATAINGKSLSLNYSTIEDKTITITDEDLSSYINKHKEDFKQEKSRDLEYILVNIAPSKEDSLAFRDELAKDITNFASTEDDSLYASLNSATPFDANYKAHGTFNNKEVESKLFSAPKDSVIGPLYYDGGYSIFKVTNIKEDSMSYYHILKAEVPVRGTTKQDTTDAIAAAKKIGAESKSAANSLDFFNSKASSGELSYAYDLGWVKEGSQQPEEMNKAIKTLSAGESTVVKSMFGLSLVKLVEPKSNKLIQVAEVRKLVAPLKSTEDAAFQKALTFRNSLTGGKDEFETKTKKAGFAKSIASNVKESDRTISSIPGTLEVIRWAFGEDRNEGDYSDIISTENMLIVAHLAKIKEEGTAKVDDVRERVTKLVLNEKKAEKLKETLNNALKNSKSIDAIAAAVKTTVQPINNLNFYSPNVQFAGNDPKLVGFVCGLKLNELSKPIASNDGVHLFIVESINKPEIPSDLKARQQQIYGQKKQQIYNIVLGDLKKLCKVKDERFKFY